MKLIKTKQPQCMLFTAAMLLDENPNDLVKELGHSGTERVYEVDHPIKSMRGFHMQEIVDLFMAHDKALIRVERCPILGPSHDTAIHPFEDREDERFFEYLEGNHAYLLGFSASGYHAVAWDGERVYDPKGYVYELPSDKFEPREAWIVYAIR